MENVLSKARMVLSTTPARWLELIDQLPTDLLEHPAALGEWSALDCLSHLVDTEQFVFPVRVRAFLAGQDLVNFDPDAQVQGRDKGVPRRLAEEFARLRAESLALLESLNPSDLARTAMHSEFGQVTLGEMIHEWAAHDLMHTVQAERAIMQPFIASCGPWKPYFTDHTVVQD
jgi:DinB superfamily